MLTESLNETLKPIRQKRSELEKDEAYIKQVLHNGIESARKMAIHTLEEVRRAMNMEI